MIGWVLNIAVGQEYECFVEGTLITLADGSYKFVEDITYDDELLVWNFDEGKLDTAKPVWIDTPGIAGFYYITTFSDGTIIKTVGPERLNGASHRIFNIDKSRFEYLSDSIWNDVYSLEGNKQIVSHIKVKEPVRYYNLMTNKHINLFANGLLTSSRLNNLYPIKDMKFIKEERNIDLSVYKDIPQEYINGLRLSEQLTDVSDYIKNMVSKALKKD